MGCGTELGLRWEIENHVAQTNKEGGAVCVSSGWLVGDGVPHRIDRLVLVGRLIGISLDDANSFRQDALPSSVHSYCGASSTQDDATSVCSGISILSSADASIRATMEDQGTASEVRAPHDANLAHFWRHFGSIVRALTMRSFALTCLYFAPTARCVVAQLSPDPPQGAPRKSLLPS